jgi:hypothetical protein
VARNANSRHLSAVLLALVAVLTTLGIAVIPLTAEATPSLDGSAKPAEVRVGFLINDIQDIDLERHRYQIDFYIWFQWTDPDLDPPASMEFMNDAERWATMRSAASEMPVRLDDGSFYYRERILSMFTSNLPIEDYPYETLNLEVIVEDSALASSELVYVLDEPAVQSAADLSVPGYRISPPTATVTNWEYPAMGAIADTPSSSSRIVLTIDLDRPWLPTSLKIFVPLIIVVLCAALVFLIRPDHVDARFGLGISALLTLVALKWITDDEIPLIDHLALVDALYIFAFVFVGAVLAQTTFASWQRDHGVDDAVIIANDKRVLRLTGVALITGWVVVMFVYAWT